MIEASCIFCRIVKGELPSEKIYEDKNFIAIMDIMPANKGHVLIISKEHYETITDIPEKLLREMIAVVQKIAKAVVKGLDAEGLNILQYNKLVSGQTIPHVHFHIIPRFKDDGLRINWPQGRYEGNELRKYADRIKVALK